MQKASIWDPGDLLPVWLDSTDPDGPIAWSYIRQVPVSDKEKHTFIIFCLPFSVQVYLGHPSSGSSGYTIILSSILPSHNLSEVKITQYNIWTWFSQVLVQYYHYTTSAIL